MGRPKTISKNSVRSEDSAPAPPTSMRRIGDERARTEQLQAKLAAKVAARTARTLQRDTKLQPASPEGDYSDDEIAPAATQVLVGQLSPPADKIPLTADKENTPLYTSKIGFVGANPVPHTDADISLVPNPLPALASPAPSERRALRAISEHDDLRRRWRLANCSRAHEAPDAEQSHLLSPKSQHTALTSSGGSEQLVPASSIIKVRRYLPTCRSPLPHTI